MLFQFHLQSLATFQININYFYVVFIKVQMGNLGLLIKAKDKHNVLQKKKNHNKMQITNVKFCTYMRRNC